MNTTNQLRLSFLFIIISSFSLSSLAQQSVTWVNQSNTSFSGNNLTKTSSSTSWNAGAASYEKIDPMIDGYVKASISATDTYIILGLSTDNPNDEYSSIDFGLYLRAGEIRIIESGTTNYNPGNHTYNIGDTFKVERIGTEIVYKHNDSTFYTSNLESIFSLIVDVSIYSPGASLDNVTISNSFSFEPTDTNGVTQEIEWIDIHNLNFVDSTVVSSIGGGWYSGAASGNRLNANVDGYLEATVLGNNTYLIFGLSENNTDLNSNSIDYGLYLYAGTLRVHEDGITKYNPFNHSYNSGDIFRVERIGNDMVYKKNGNIFYVSEKPSNTSLIVDMSFYDAGATLFNVKVSSSFISTSTSGPDEYWDQGNDGIFYNDKVSIGTSLPLTDHLLSVNGKIATKGVKVTLDGWADFVFEKDYDLMSLNDLKKYIKENGHLPEIPDASQVIKEGIYLGEMNKKLLQKIEELTLYLIQQNEKIQQLEKKIGEIKN